MTGNSLKIYNLGVVNFLTSLSWQRAINAEHYKNDYLFVLELNIYIYITFSDIFLCTLLEDAKSTTRC